MRKAVVGFCLLFVCASLGRGAEIHEEEVQTVPLRSGARFTIRMGDGAVRLSTWNKDEAEIHILRRVWASNRRRAQERMEELEVEVRRHGDDVQVVVYDRGERREVSFWDLFNPETWQSDRGAEVEFDVRVPEGVRIWIEADDADIQITGKQARLSISVDDGDVELQKVASDYVRIETDDGDVDLYDVSVPEGRIAIVTDDGRVRLEDCEARDVDAETDDADVVLLGCIFERFDARTAGGDVELEPVLKRTERIRADTEEGDVIVVLPEDADADLDLETASGRIRSDFDVRIDRTDEGERVRDRIGGGDVRIVVTTEDGDIILEKR